jgi:hypothetical protein
MPDVQLQGLGDRGAVVQVGQRPLATQSTGEHPRGRTGQPAIGSRMAKHPCQA